MAIVAGLRSNKKIIIIIYYTSKTRELIALLYSN